jgi:hypothetical protein
MWIQVTATGWVGFGIAETGGMKGADIVYYETSTNQLTDAYALEFAFPQRDEQQDWMLLSAEVKGGKLSFEAVRDLDTQDPQDTPLYDDSWPAIDGTRIIAAWGDSSSIQYHGQNRVNYELHLFKTPASDPLAAVKSNPQVKTFDLVQKNFKIPISSTTYDHQCVPLSSKWGGPIPNNTMQHIVAVEYLPDTTSTNPSGNIHHFILSCYKSLGFGPVPSIPNASDVWFANVSNISFFTGYT